MYVSLLQGLLKESERRKVELTSLTETSAGLQTLVEDSGPPLEEKLGGINEAWGRVRTWTEDWLSAVLVGADIYTYVFFILRSKLLLIFIWTNLE